MTAPVIDLDETSTGPLSEAGTSEAPAAAPFSKWWTAWSTARPVAAGAVVAGAIALVLGVGAMGVAVVRWWPAPAAPQVAPSYVVSVSTADAEEVSTAVVRRAPDGSDFLARGEVLGEHALLEGVVSVSITVRGAKASCAITVNEVLATDAEVLEGEQMATCLWLAPTR